MITNIVVGNTYHTVLPKLKKAQAVEVLKCVPPIVTVKILNGLNSGQECRLSVNTFKETYFDNIEVAKANTQY